jgi:hypothetical protein
MSETKSCATCQFVEKVYEPPPAIASHLICRKDPIPGSIPQPLPNGTVNWIPLVRMTSEKNWCYEYERRMDA